MKTCEIRKLREQNSGHIDEIFLNAHLAGSEPFQMFIFSQSQISFWHSQTYLHCCLPFSSFEINLVIKLILIATTFGMSRWVAANVFFSKILHMVSIACYESKDTSLTDRNKMCFSDQLPLCMSTSFWKSPWKTISMHWHYAVISILIHDATDVHLEALWFGKKPRSAQVGESLVV